MKRLIYTSYASADGVGNPLYLRCCVVSLVSFRIMNPEDDIALFTNVEVKDDFLNVLKENNIKVKKVEFNKFVFPSDMLWSLAFYKLCVLDYITRESDYDLYLGVDSDTYCIRNLSDMWIEASNNILLFNLGHSFFHPQSIQMDREYKELTGESCHLVNYGGEFIAGSKKKLRELADDCCEIYVQMRKANLRTKHGDEFILCSAAKKKKDIIETGNAYIFRYFTGRFYLSSTVYKYNQIAIMHLPSEKSNGFCSVYKYYMRHKKLPELRQLLKMMEIQTAERPVNVYTVRYFVKKMMKKLGT